MTDKPVKRPQVPERIDVGDESLLKEFQVHLVKESSHWIMILLFFTASFMIYFKLQVTLITLLEASKILLGFGFIGFLILYLVRNRFGFGLLDGLYYSAFATAPISLALFLFLNGLCYDSYTELHHIVGFEAEGKGYTYELENNAFEDYWRIRNMRQSPYDLPIPRLEFTLCNGVFGYRVIKNIEMR